MFFKNNDSIKFDKKKFLITIFIPLIVNLLINYLYFKYIIKISNLGFTYLIVAPAIPLLAGLFGFYPYSNIQSRKQHMVFFLYVLIMQILLIVETMIVSSQFGSGL